MMPAGDWVPGGHLIDISCQSSYYSGMANSTAPKTVGRNATRKIAAIRAAVVRCNSHSLDGGFHATPCDPAYAFARWEKLSFARLLDYGNGKYVIHLHSNSWYELFTDSYAG
jgi:hypothetical protein